MKNISQHAHSNSRLEGGVVEYRFRRKAYLPHGWNCNRVALMLFAALYLFLCTAHAQTDVPYLSGRVNDYANLLSSNTITELEAVLQAHEDSTSNQVAVLIIPSLGNEVLEAYSIRVVETWKLGRAEQDNGVLLLIARNDRKMRIEVGNGLEGNLPDITCGRIIRNEIAPRFKAGDYDAGVRNGVHAILAAIAGAYTASDTAEESAQPEWQFRLMFFGIFIIVVGVFTYICVVSGKTGWVLYFFLMPFWLVFPMVSFGLKGGLLLFLLYVFGIGALKVWLLKSTAGKVVSKKWEKKWAGNAARSSYRSGGSWSSSSWSSSSSSSSFSGGGGSFSGGGASGSW